ncbi:hypothetical protein [Enterococcus casseliflavus]|uniref:hypothetical protein n=1 Tax=Enterococcus casseliflavus TaxID=37734 RepID=UPI0034D25EF8
MTKPQSKKVWLFLLVIGIILTVCLVGNHLFKQREDKESYESMTEQIEQIDTLTQENRLLKEQLSAENHSVAKAREEQKNIESERLSEESTKQLVDTVHAFLEVYDGCSTENVDEKMKEIYPIMTQKAQEELRPYFMEDANITKIDSSIQISKSYVFVPSKNEAEVLTFAVATKEFNEEYSYTNQIIIQTKLLLEDEIWKIDNRIDAILDAHFLNAMFELK